MFGRAKAAGKGAGCQNRHGKSAIGAIPSENGIGERCRGDASGVPDQPTFRPVNNGSVFFLRARCGAKSARGGGVCAVFVGGGGGAPPATVVVSRGGEPIQAMPY